MNKIKCLVIGSGMAGLTAAAYLAKEGYEVIVYEQFSEIGGITATIHQNGYSWDIGPLMIEFLLPHEGGGIVLSELGLNDSIKLICGERHMVFPDFKLINPKKKNTAKYWRKEKLKELFPLEKEGIDRYYQFYERLMKLIYTARKLDEKKNLIAFLLKIKLFIKAISLRKMKDWSAADFTDHFFKDPKLKAVFTIFLADFGARPSQFPGLIVPIVNNEVSFDKNLEGCWTYIEGGCGKLVEAIANVIQRNGGIIKTNTSVRKINIENGKIKGLTLNTDEFERADIILASGGARETFLGLIGREYLPPDFSKNVEKLPLMDSIFMVHIGIDFDPTPFQSEPLCYYYGTYDVETGVGRTKLGEYHEGKDGFIIYISTLHSPEMAPPHHHAVTLYTIAPDRLKERTWADVKELMADKLVKEAEKFIPGLKEHTKIRVIITPEDYRARTYLEHHSFGGWIPTIGTKPIPHDTPIKGFWFIGAQTEDGGGVAKVMIGSRKTVKKILKKYK